MKHFPMVLINLFKCVIYEINKTQYEHNITTYICTSELKVKRYSAFASHIMITLFIICKLQ